MILYVGGVDTAELGLVVDRAGISATGVPGANWYNIPSRTNIPHLTPSASTTCPACSISSVSDGNSTNDPTSATIDNNQWNTIIGVCVTFGTIALAVFIWWMLKTRQQRRWNVHKHLSHPTMAPLARHK